MICEECGSERVKVAFMDGIGPFNTEVHLMWVCEHCLAGPIDIEWPLHYGNYVTTRQLRRDGYKIEN